MGVYVRNAIIPFRLYYIAHVAFFLRVPTAYMSNDAKSLSIRWSALTRMIQLLQLTLPRTGGNQ